MRVNDRCVELIKNCPEKSKVMSKLSKLSTKAICCMKKQSDKTKLCTIKKLATFFKVDWRELTDELYDERSVPVQSELLYDRMIELGLDYKTIAQQTNMSYGTVYALMNGRNTSKATLLKVGEVLGMTMDEMRMEE